MQNEKPTVIFSNPMMKSKKFLLGMVLGQALGLSVVAADWPQWLGVERDGVWRESGILKKFPEGGPKVNWRVPIGGGYAGPAVADGRVFIMDRHLAKGTANPDNQFDRGMIPGSERVICLEEKTGRELWVHEYECGYTVSYPAGPRATATVDGDRVYTLGAEGNLLCLNAESGKMLWQKDFKKEYGVKSPVWGFTGHPLVRGGHLICLARGKGSTAVCFDKLTGKEVWRSLTAREPGYCPPTLIQAGGVEQLIIWHPESINSLNPDTGEVYWTQPFRLRFGLSVPTPRQVGDQLFVTAFYNGPMMMNLAKDKPTATLAWKGNRNSEKNTDKLHSIMPTPFIEKGHIYGVCSYGQLRCLRVDTGERVWEDLTATRGGEETRWGNAFLVKHAPSDRFFLFNELGDLIIAKLSPKSYAPIDKAHLIEPTGKAMNRKVVWSHPAFANRNVLVRNDKEIVSFSLAE